MYGGIKKGLSVAVIDPHNGMLMKERTFLIDGLKVGAGSCAARRSRFCMVASQRV